MEDSLAVELKSAKKNPRNLEIASTVGVVGMGLMGTSIAACLLVAGHQVVCVEIDSAKRRTALRRLLRVLNESHAHGVSASPGAKLIKHAWIVEDVMELREAQVVVESTVENVAVKRQVIAHIESAVKRRTLIGTNTSAIPVTELQRGAKYPDRILGLHWAEPANVTRFMEVICGKQTSLASASRAMKLARQWGKEPSLLRKDIRGFITNRIMYAMLREAFFLVDEGYATVADVDRSLRNDLGAWITFAGPFRFMDLTGIPAYATVMKDLLPDLNRATLVPRLMKKVVASGARGVSNAKGFYRYTPAQAKRWDDLFMKFSHEIREVAARYPENVGDLASAKRGRKRSAH